MGYMKSLDIDAQEALEMVANLVGAEQVPDHGELLEGLRKLGWVAPTAARAAYERAADGLIAYEDQSLSFMGAAHIMADKLRAVQTLLEPTA